MLAKAQGIQGSAVREPKDLKAALRRGVDAIYERVLVVRERANRKYALVLESVTRGAPKVSPRPGGLVQPAPIEHERTQFQNRSEFVRVHGLPRGSSPNAGQKSGLRLVR